MPRAGAAVAVRQTPNSQPGSAAYIDNDQPVAQFESPTDTLTSMGVAKPTRKRLRSTMLPIGAAVLLVAVGLFINIQAWQTNHSSKAQVAALAQQGLAGSDDPVTPSENKPTTYSISSYAVAPTLPKYLKIPKLTVNTRILQTSINSDGTLGSPSNIYDAAWYAGSAHPGEDGGSGAVLIDGYAEGKTRPGVFADLNKLAVGDTLQVVRGDDKIFSYKVVKVQDFNAKIMDMVQILASAQPGRAGLNLITCGDPHYKNSGEYTGRTAVFAVQAD
jgi:LPXTG-site transpeptidase (sortase) family protein